MMLNRQNGQRGLDDGTVDAILSALPTMNEEQGYLSPVIPTMSRRVFELENDDDDACSSVASTDDEADETEDTGKIEEDDCDDDDADSVGTGMPSLASINAGSVRTLSTRSCFSSNFGSIVSSSDQSIDGNLPSITPRRPQRLRSMLLSEVFEESSSALSCATNNAATTLDCLEPVAARPRPEAQDEKKAARWVGDSSSSKNNFLSASSDFSTFSLVSTTPTDFSASCDSLRDSGHELASRNSDDSVPGLPSARPFSDQLPKKPSRKPSCDASFARRAARLRKELGIKRVSSRLEGAEKNFFPTVVDEEDNKLSIDFVPEPPRRHHSSKNANHNSKRAFFQREVSELTIGTVLIVDDEDEEDDDADDSRYY